MKLKHLFILALLIALPLACSAEKPSKAVSTDAYSYSVPETWEVMDMPGTGIKVSKTKTGEANINVVSQPFQGSLADYVKANVEQMEMIKVKKLSEGSFKTDAGLEGTKVVAENTMTGQTMRQTFYFFKGKGDVMYVVTCTAAKDVDNYASVFDSAVKTFVPKQ